MRYTRGWGLDAPREWGEIPPLSSCTSIDYGVCARSIGPVVRQLIEQECTGQVLGAVTGTIYLLTADGEMCWLAQNHLPMHTRAISAPFHATRVRPGMPFTANAGRLHLDRDWFVDCMTAVTWDPPAIDPDRVARSGVVRERVQPLLHYAERNALPDQGRSFIREIESACQERDLARAVWSCYGLVGMGPGLTPAGDDFVGGLVFTLYCLHPLYPDRVRWNPPLVRALIDYARASTNAVSYHLLRDYAAGQAAEPLHRLLADILSEDGGSDLTDSVRQVIGIGNTSGTELLAGALTALKFLDHRGDSNDN